MSRYQSSIKRNALQGIKYLVYLKTTFFTCINSNLHQGLHIWAASHNSRYFHKLPNVGCLHLPNGEWSHLWKCLDVNLTATPKTEITYRQRLIIGSTGQIIGVQFQSCTVLSGSKHIITALTKFKQEHKTQIFISSWQVTSLYPESTSL